MLRVALVNVPFADWNRPSIALSQLCAVTRREFGDRVDARVEYLNIEFAEYFGSRLYYDIANSMGHLVRGLGDWVFRDLAFPELSDNSEEYFRKHYRDPQLADFRESLLERRATLADACADLVDKYALDSVDVVGFTSMFAQQVPSIAFARMIKERNPNTLIVMGGANCETPMGSVVAERVDAVDFVFSGPALHTFPDFVGHLLDGDTDAVHAIPGILSRKNCNDPRYRNAVGRERDIDDFVEPEYASFKKAFDAKRDALASDGTPAHPVLYFETSRGCWWGQRSHCTFCGLNGLNMGYRSMSPENAIRQFEWLYQYFPWCKHFACTDNILPKSYPKHVFPKLDPPPGTTFFYEIKLPVSDADMRALARANVNEVQPGIESLATSTLKLMKKGTTAFQNIQFLRSCIRYKILPHWNLLIGFPGEEENVFPKYAYDIPALVHLTPPMGGAIVRFDRFSPYFTNSEEYNLELKPLEFYKMIYPFGDEEIARMAYFFGDRSESPPYVLNAVKWLSTLVKLVGHWQERWSDEARRPELRLREEEGVRFVYDSRFTEGTRVDLGDTSQAVLAYLASPRRFDRIGRDLDLSDDEVEGQLRFLREYRLLFEEGDRVMSLVITEHEPAASQDVAAPRMLDIVAAD